MTRISVEEAQSRLPQNIAELVVGEEVVIVHNGEPIAKLTRNRATSWPCKAGSAKDTIHWMSPDFDAPLEEFREYME